MVLGEINRERLDYRLENLERINLNETLTDFLLKLLRSEFNNDSEYREYSNTAIMNFALLNLYLNMKDDEYDSVIEGLQENLAVMFFDSLKF